MSYFFKLSFNGPINLLFPVSMNINPYGRYTVYILPSLCIVNLLPISLFNNKRGISQPLLHLGKGMPYVLLVLFFQYRCPLIHSVNN